MGYAFEISYLYHQKILVWEPHVVAVGHALAVESILSILLIFPTY